MDYFLDDEKAVERLVEEWEKYGSIIVGVDFDDTLYDFHGKGRTYNDVIRLLRQCKEQGAYIIVSTCCGEGEYSKIRNYMLTNNIPYDIINENSPSTPFKGRKVYCNILLDDRAGLSASYHQLNEALNRIIFKKEGMQK